MDFVASTFVASASTTSRDRKLPGPILLVGALGEELKSMPNRAPSPLDGTLLRRAPGDRQGPRRRFVNLTAAPLLAGSLLLGSLAAQDPPPIVQEEGDYYVLNVGEREGTDIKAFIKLAQLITKKTFIYGDQDIDNAPDNKVTWVGTKRVRKDNFFAYFQTILYIKGFATVIHGDADTEIIEIIYRQGPKRPELSTKAVFITPDEIGDYANQTGVQVLTSVPLKHIDATAAQNTLRPFFLGGGAAATGATLQFGVAGRSLLLQGFGPQVYAAYQLLLLVDQELDVPEHEVRITKLVNAAADELEVILKDILEDRARRQQQATGASGAALQPTQSGELKIVPHNTLNAIILSGTRDQVIEGQGLIALLDVPVEANGGDTHVVRLKNVLADDLYDTLNRFIEQDSTAERANTGQAGATTRQPRRTVVVPHKESNSLLVSGTSTKFKQLQRVIDELDSRQPQVLIECAVIELATRRLGAAWPSSWACSTSAAQRLHAALRLHELRAERPSTTTTETASPTPDCRRLRGPAAGIDRRHHQQRVTSRSRSMINALAADNAAPTSSACRASS